MTNKKVKIMIFGTGEGSRRVLELIDLEKVDIVGYLDNDKSKQDKTHNGVKVLSPDRIDTYNYDYIVIGSMYYKEITNQLIEMKVDRNKIVKLLDKKNKEKTAKQLVKEIYRDNLKYSSIVKDMYLAYYYNDYAICNMHLSQNQRNMKLYKYPDYLLSGIDYVRVSTVELISNEIKERNIQGAVAELGVYKGDFSRLISDFFPDRKIYLFDTFEGFSQNDIKLEQEKKFSRAKEGHLGDTNVELVMKRMANKDNVIIKKGYFPRSTCGMEEEIFAFVSIDVDLYKPTLEGLYYFYERLSKGGYILVHDYNFHHYKGIKRAIRDFCQEIEINYVPLSDYFGSVIIVK